MAYIHIILGSVGMLFGFCLSLYGFSKTFGWGIPFRYNLMFGVGFVLVYNGVLFMLI